MRGLQDLGAGLQALQHQMVSIIWVTELEDITHRLAMLLMRSS